MSKFKPGKITFVLDGGAGSSAKGLRAANIWKNSKEPHTTFAVNTFMENAAHTVTHEDGTEYIYQCLSSITSLGNYEKQYISPGAVFALKTVLNEISRHGLTPKNLGIHPNVAIVQDYDIEYERGTIDFEGNPKKVQASSMLNIGSTLHGVGAARARRVLRRPDSVLARDVPELTPFICDTSEEILTRLNNGESGLMEIAQGWQLSLFSRFFPKCTSRNCSIAAGLDDSMLPPSVAGPVIINFRTFPIRVNSNKYIRNSDKKILTWDEWNSTPESDRTMVNGDSGGCYDDQTELTWDQISEMAGKRLLEQTSLTKLPRRIYTFSRKNMLESVIHNYTGDDVYISVNFVNYVDGSVENKRGYNNVMTDKVISWIQSNLSPVFRQLKDRKINVSGLYLGTWKTIDSSTFIDFSQTEQWIGD